MISFSKRDLIHKLYTWWLHIYSTISPPKCNCRSNFSFYVFDHLLFFISQGEISCSIFVDYMLQIQLPVNFFFFSPLFFNITYLLTPGVIPYSRLRDSNTSFSQFWQSTATWPKCNRYSIFLFFIFVNTTYFFPPREFKYIIPMHVPVGFHFSWLYNSNGN